ncbi:ABC transporter permease [Kribbella sp. NPDC003505]|uniref:ABC transporter permease n=1 Tax=Kribbella sp. NPDC003505 TaxID=3154448 RepID=UPI0033AA6A92
MTGLRQAWLVARREIRERSRSRSFRAGLVVMLVVVIALIVVPAKLDIGGGPKDVGVTSTVPSALSLAILARAGASGATVRLHRYGDVSAGEEAVRAHDVDVLVVDARRLEWPGRVNEQLQAVVTGAIQLVAVQERAAAAGIGPDDLRGLMAPVPVENVEFGSAAGRSPDDELAAIVITTLLLMAIVIYGNLVLTGVVEEKSSRVVEVLLARMPARVLLAGKVAGIGLLGFAQFVLTAVAALLAALVIDSVDMPAVRAGVLAWAVVWFVLGYALYAMAYGALGSLASRTEDAQSVAGPVGYVLIACYWGAFLTVSANPDGVWARTLSQFPATAPFAMPGRIALGSVAWWEPLLAVTLTLAAIAGLVAIAGRVYTNAILHSGATLHLRDAWHGEIRPSRGSGQDDRRDSSGAAASDRDRRTTARSATSRGSGRFSTGRFGRK